MEPLSPQHWDLLFALAKRVVPALDSSRREPFEAIVRAALLDRPAMLQRQLRLLLTAIRWGAALRFGATFERLTADRQDRWLACLQDFPLPIVRKGFWGLKALIFMGFYGRVEAGPEIGWTPALDGNSRLRG